MFRDERGEAAIGEYAVGGFAPGKYAVGGFASGEYALGEAQCKTKEEYLQIDSCITEHVIGRITPDVFEAKPGVVGDVEPRLPSW